MPKGTIEKPLIIFGSNRAKGNTWQAVELVTKGRDAEIIDLQQYDFSEFDYDQGNQDDDFSKLTEKMLEHEKIVLATPIYWYSMSARMKKFIDRWSDFLTVNKEAGRKIRGKKLFVITSYYTHPEGKADFEEVFKKICKYMGMEYSGCFFHYAGDKADMLAANEENAENFARKLFV